MEKRAEANLYMAGVLGKNQKKSSPENPARNVDEDRKIKRSAPEIYTMFGGISGTILLQKKTKI